MTQSISIDKTAAGLTSYKRDLLWAVYRRIKPPRRPSVRT